MVVLYFSSLFFTLEQMSLLQINFYLFIFEQNLKTKGKKLLRSLPFLTSCCFLSDFPYFIVQSNSQ